MTNPEIKILQSQTPGIEKKLESAVHSPLPRAVNIEEVNYRFKQTTLYFKLFKNFSENVF